MISFLKGQKGKLHSPVSPLLMSTELKKKKNEHRIHGSRFCKPHLDVSARARAIIKV